MLMNKAVCVDSAEKILAMRKMESSYCLQSLVHQQEQQSNSGSSSTPLCDSWRSKVTQWAFNVVDHFSLSREVVAVSMNIFDRYLATRGNVCSGNVVLLTSLTTLHLAIKLHETKRIKSSILASLSRGQFDASHIAEMEMKILTALGWKLSSPSPLAFIAEFIAFLPDEVSPAERKEVYELSKYMTELAVCESSFVGRQSSVVALAAIRNVMETMSFEWLSEEAKDGFLDTLAELMGHTHESSTMQETKERLMALFAKVSASEAYEQPSSYATTPPHHHRSSKVVSPSGSPSSTASNQYEVVCSAAADPRGYNCHSRMATSRTNFWYTPSPPSSFGITTSSRMGQVA